MSWPAEISFAQPGIDELAKLNFAYITTNICPDGAEIDEIGCTDCSCVERNPLGPLMFEFSSSKAGRQKEQRLFPLIHGILHHASTTIFVCGPHCSSCKGTCSNSLNASRLQHPLELRAAAAAAGGRDGKGIGVFSCSFISLGSFVCEYVGECVSGVEATKRLKKYDGDVENVARGRGHALLMVREVLPSRSAAVRSYIDATVKGNVARFINHSCDGGNLNLVLVRSPGALLPRACFFANRSIDKGEELTYSYGPPNPGNHPGARRCYCGSAACKQFMPQELF